MNDWLDFVLALIGFAMGWVLASFIERRYHPAGREPADGGA